MRVFSCGELDFIFPQQLRELNPGGHSVNSGAVLYDLTHIPSTLLAAACAIAAQPSLHDVRIRFYGLDHFLMGLSRPANVRSYKHRPCPPALHRMASAGSPIRVRTRSFAHGRAHSIVFHGIILSCLSCHSSCLSHRPMSWYLQLRVSVRCRGSLSLSSATFVAVIFFLSGLFVCRILFSSAGISIYPALFSVQRMRPRC